MKIKNKNFFSLILVIILSTTVCLNNYIVKNISYSNKNRSVEIILKDGSVDEYVQGNYGINELEEGVLIKPIKDLNVRIDLECDSTLHYAIRDSNNERFEINQTDQNYLNYLLTCKNNMTLSQFGLILPELDQKFSFTINKNNTNIYSFNKENFLYSDNLIVFETLLTTKEIYGFGERRTSFKLDIGKYTTWPNDTTHTYEDEKIGGFNLMGHQPIGLHKTGNNLFLGFIFMNLNAQDTMIKEVNIDNYSNSIEHRTIGGIIDYYIVTGDTPDETIKKIHKIIGLPTMPPLWSFGWHQSRWGYDKLEDMIEVYEMYKYHQLPIDSIWNDVEGLYKNRNFHYNFLDFPNLPSFTDYLHREKLHYIALVDYAIPITDTDQYYNDGINNKCFILSNYSKRELITNVWPGRCMFPDIFIERCQKLWYNGLKNFNNDINYDGMWIDMNEPGMLDPLPGGRGEYFDLKSDHYNSVGRKKFLSSEFYDPLKNLYGKLPYIPGKRKNHSDLETKGVSLNAYSHLNDPKNNFYVMYNVRALISKVQVEVTNKYLIDSNRRPFILSRANTIGHGKFGFHWLGDNDSTFDDLKRSISGIFNFNIFGIPMTGADICGFHRNTTDELCARWHILGSLYPFSRNHNLKGNKPQEPWVFEKNLTLNAAKLGINLRYSLIRYIYSQMFLISIGVKGSFFKPVFFEFPNDDNLYENNIMDSHIMIGSNLLFIPCLDFEKDDKTSYFPNSNWNNFFDLKSFINFNKDDNKGSFRSLNCDYDNINLFIRGGSIIPYQNVVKPFHVRNSYDLRTRFIEIIINPNENLEAKGDFIYDNDKANPLITEEYFYTKIFYNLTEINFDKKNDNMDEYNTKYKDHYISKIKILRKSQIIDKLVNGIKECEIINGDNDKIMNINVKSSDRHDSLEINLTDLKISIFKIKKINLLSSP